MYTLNRMVRKENNMKRFKELVKEFKLQNFAEMNLFINF